LKASAGQVVILFVYLAAVFMSLSLIPSLEDALFLPAQVSPVFQIQNIACSLNMHSLNINNNKIVPALEAND